MTERAGRYWTEFGNSTGLYSFSFLSKSKHMFERIFWILATAVGIWYTVSDVKNSIQTYMSFPTAIQLQVLTNDTMQLSDLTVCLDFDVSEMAQNVDDITDVTAVTDFLNKTNDVNLLEIFSIYPNIDTISEQTRMWLGLVIGVLTSIVRSEQRISEKAEAFQWGFPLRTNHSSDFRTDELTGTEALKLVNKWMETRYNYSQLVQYVGRFLCRQIKLQVMKKSVKGDRWSLNLTDPCELNSITWFGSPPQNFVDTEICCIKLNSAYFKFIHPVESSLITVVPQDIYLNRSVSNFGRFVYLSFHEPFLTLESYNLVSIPRGSRVLLTVTILGDYSELYSEKNPCGPSRIQPCILKCRAKYIGEKCGCQPLSYSTGLGADELPTCGSSLSNEGDFILSQNYDCQLIQSRYKPNQTCTDSCLPTCRSLLYSITSTWDETLKEKHRIDENATIFDISFDVFKYPLVEEIQLMTAKDLFASLGGNLSLYLGASFIVVVHGFAFFLNVVLTEIRLRCTEKERTGRNLPIKSSFSNTKV